MERERERDLAQQTIKLLRTELRRAHVRENQLLRLLAEKDEQIKTVIDEKYFHPVNPVERARKAIEKPIVSIDELNDQTRFDPEKDAEAVEDGERAYEAAQAALEAELDALEQEQLAAGVAAEPPLPAEEAEPVEVES